jgi:CheY-like chemotaxis protein
VPTILIVEDEPQIRGLLGTMLLRAGYAVQTASSPQVAIEICTPPVCPDLVLSEVSMPVMDGHELARWIASRCPASRTILMSDAAMACGECPYAPHCAFIQKPFDPKLVLATVASALAEPVSIKCSVAQLLSANYSAALKAFYGFPSAMQGEELSEKADYGGALKQKEAAYVALLIARAEYSAHIYQHGCQQPRMATATYQEIKSRLRREMMDARAVFEDASDKLERLTSLLPKLEPDSEAPQLLQHTKHVHHAAHQVYMMALQRFSDFIRDEIFHRDKGEKPS